jgi:hypothetical protein
MTEGGGSTTGRDPVGALVIVTDRRSPHELMGGSASTLYLLSTYLLRRAFERIGLRLRCARDGRRGRMGRTLAPS